MIYVNPFIESLAFHSIKVSLSLISMDSSDVPIPGAYANTHPIFWQTNNYFRYVPIHIQYSVYLLVSVIMSIVSIIMSMTQAINDAIITRNDIIGTLIQK